MSQQLIRHICLGFFGIFVGAQIVEGALMVPHWLSMNPSEFHEFYSTFGPGIGRFFTILTVIAALIAIGIAIKDWKQKSDGWVYSIIAALLMIICIAMFYIYFKGANELFYAAPMDVQEMQDQLGRWSDIHWARVGLEIIALVCLSASGIQRGTRT